MKGKKHSAEQIIRKLREADAMLPAASVDELLALLPHHWRPA